MNSSSNSETNAVSDQISIIVGSPGGIVGSPGGLSWASDDDNCPSSAGSGYEEATDLMGDEVIAQLAAAGPVGVAAAAAIVSVKKRKRPHSFETNPSIRKRQQNRLLRKLRQTIDEFTTRVGQQAIVLVATPGKPNTSYKVFGAQPLEGVVKNLRSMIMEELENALAHQAPPPVQDPSLFELPPLIIDGIPTPVEKMTQAQLRAFIPLMLKYSTGRGKPGWGRESTQPPWWPKALPWANVRMDARSEDEKQKISWTHALRQIVINCYKFHSREDLLPAFTEVDEKANTTATANVNNVQSRIHKTNHISKPLNYRDGIVNDTPDLAQITTEYAPTVLHTITNPDGTVSIVQVDSNNPIITLPDGTTAHVQEMTTIQSTPGEAIETFTEGEVVELNSEGQIILTGEDGHGYPLSVSGIITISDSTYQTMLTNIPHLHTNSDGTVSVTPFVQVPKVEPNSNDTMETLTVAPGGLTTHSMMIQGSGTDPPHVLQVLSLKDVTVLTKAISDITDVKTEETIISDQ